MRRGRIFEPHGDTTVQSFVNHLGTLTVRQSCNGNRQPNVGMQLRTASIASVDLQAAWTIAATTGLDLEKARLEVRGDDITAVLEQDMADVETFKISKTPTLFVNGQELFDVGPQQLADAVEAAVATGE